MDLLAKLEKLNSALKIDEKKARIKELEGEMNSPDFWIGENDTTAVASELKSLKEEVKKYDDLFELATIADDEGEEVEGLKSDIEELEKLTKYTGKYDEKGAILNFFAGAGGDDAQDWTAMLLRMYIKWAENSGLSAKVIDQSKGGVAGIKNAILRVDGRYTYGKLKSENGVHRLVRQSPFNSKNLRQTSFSLVEVLPKIDEKDKNIELPENDLRVDTFRASGHGGQSVNTTDSAVRITHIPTNTVVTCQNEKSQLQNKFSAMSVLKSRLAKLLEDQHKEKISEIRGEASEPEWGSQIRSYVLHPYKQVKDHRTNVVSKNPDDVLDGNIGDFIL